MDNNRKVVELPLDDVLPNRFQPRIKFNEEPINELASSIKEHGVIQPIVVRAVGDRYEIIAGERRFKAATLAGLQTIPAIITDLNDKDSAEVALIENVQRQDLTPIEEAISYKKILDMGYLTQDELAQKLGKNQSTIANKLRLLNLDEEVQEALLNGKISERHARSLLKLTNMDDQVKLLNKIIEERLTVRKTDEEINNMLNGNNNQENIKDIEVLDFEEPIIIPNEETFNFNIPTNPILEPEDNEGVDGTQNILNPFMPSFIPEFEEQVNNEISNNETTIPAFNDLLTPITEEQSINNEINSDATAVPSFNDLLMSNSEEEIINNEISNNETTIPAFNDLLTPISEEQSINNEISSDATAIPSFNDLLTQTTEEEPTLEPNKFFNLLEEEKEIPTKPSTPEFNYNFDFNNFELPSENNVSNVEESNFTISPNFGFPNIDESSFIPNVELEEKAESTGTNTYVTGDIKTVVNTIKNCADTIEKYGFIVDTEEFDLEDMYQIIFKVHKK